MTFKVCYTKSSNGTEVYSTFESYKFEWALNFATKLFNSGYENIEIENTISGEFYSLKNQCWKGKQEDSKKFTNIQVDGVEYNSMYEALKALAR